MSTGNGQSAPVSGNGQQPPRPPKRLSAQNTAQLPAAAACGDKPARWRSH